jgi:hypothetical protein
VFDVLLTYISKGGGVLKSRHTLSGDTPKIVRHFFKWPPRLSGPLAEVMPQVMEGDILDHFLLDLCGPSLELAEPVVDGFFRQPLAALREKHIGPLCVTSSLLVHVERLAGLFQ